LVEPTFASGAWRSPANAIAGGDGWVDVLANSASLGMEPNSATPPAPARMRSRCQVLGQRVHGDRPLAGSHRRPRHDRPHGAPLTRRPSSNGQSRLKFARPKALDHTS
jgi:hypothetical protein